MKVAGSDREAEAAVVAAVCPFVHDATASQASPRARTVHPDTLVSGLHARSMPTRLCPCGKGWLPIAPWVPQSEELGFCVCDEAWDERLGWRDEVEEAGKRLAGKWQLPHSLSSKSLCLASVAALGVTARFVRV